MIIKTFEPLPRNDSNTITISSFNLLAPLYIRPIDTRTGKVQPFASFDWISEEDSSEVLGDKVRLPKLLKLLQICGSDFICVQELQLERKVLCDTNESDVGKQRGKRSRKEDCCYGVVDATESSSYVLPEWISPLVAMRSSSSAAHNGTYGVILPEQSELQKMGERNQRVLQKDAAVTNAIFYRTDRWKPGVFDCSNGNTTNCVMQGFIPAVEGSQSENCLQEPIVVVSIHLDAKSEEKRVQQLRRCLELSSKCSRCYIPPVIIAGDYNCELFRGSCVHEFLEKNDTEQSRHTLRDGRVTEKDAENECSKALRLPSNVAPDDKQMKSWNDLCDEVSDFVTDNCLLLKRIDTGTTRVAFNHDDEMGDDVISDTARCTEEAKERRMEQWHLDHIIYTSLTLSPLAKWSTLEDDEYSAKFGLPNVKVPTDHLPIAASFQLRPHPTLECEVRSKLCAGVDELEQRHINELNNLQTNLDRTREELELKHAANVEADPGETHKKKYKKKPPQEIIEHIRNSRSLKKDLKAKQQVERGEFIKGLNVLERMEVQSYLNGLSCRKWAENGR